MRLFRASVIALAALCAAHCTPAPASNAGTRSEPLPQPTAAEPGSRLVRLARIEGYANPVTGEMWMRAVDTHAPDAPDGVGVAAAALGADRPGFCEVEIESDGTIGSNEHATFEWFTWGTIDPAQRIANSDSSIDGAECWSHVDPLISGAHPEYGNFYNQGALCFRQRLGNYTGKAYERIYLDIDQFTGDRDNQAAFPPGYGDGLAAGPAYSFTPEFPGDSLRNAPSSDFGLWDFGPVADGQEIDMWMFFQNRASTDYRWEGYLIGQVHEDCDDSGDAMPDDDDCDGVINNGCGEFAQGEACFIDDDCESGSCAGDERSITLPYRGGLDRGGPTGLPEDAPVVPMDVPGTCRSGFYETCRYDGDCADDPPYAMVCESVACVHDGELRFVLEWPDDTDFDLHVTTPFGNTIEWNLDYADGGFYDLDNLGQPVSGSHIENVYFPVASFGTYEFWASNGVNLVDGNFRLSVYEGGVERVIHTGTLDTGANTQSQRFFYDFPPAVSMPANFVLGQDTFMTNAPGSSANNLAGPTHVTIDPVTGMVFVADSSNHRVLRYDNPQTLRTPAAASMVFGQTTLNGIGPGNGLNQLNNPQGVAIDGTTLWVVDAGNNRVLRFDNASALPNGPTADGVLGAGGTNSAQVNGPVGIAALGGAIWVADANRNRVLRWNNAAAKANNAAADSVLGQPSLTATNAGLSATAMNHPAGLSIQPDGTLWVADQSNNRVLRFLNAPAAAIGAAAASVLGQSTFTTNFAGSAMNQLSNVGGVAASPGSWVYVFDSGNNRILAFAPWEATQDFADARRWFVFEGIPLAGPSDGFYDGTSESLWAVDQLNNRVLRFTRGGAPGCGGGALDANQLGGTAPNITYMYISPTSVMGQTFTVEQTGTLTGIEVSVNTNAVSAAAFATLHMSVKRGPHLIAEGDIHSSAISPTELILSPSSMGTMFFPLGATCPAVTAGEVLSYELSLAGADRGVCDVGNQVCTMGKIGTFCTGDSDCDPTVNFTLDYDTNGIVIPYAGGHATQNGVAISTESGRFKVMVGP